MFLEADLQTGSEKVTIRNAARDQHEANVKREASDDVTRLELFIDSTLDKEALRQLRERIEKRLKEVEKGGAGSLVGKGKLE